MARRLPFTMSLVDPRTLVLAKAECMAKGVALHLTKDCPGPGCPVWDAWHPGWTVQDQTLIYREGTGYVPPPEPPVLDEWCRKRIR